MTTASSGDSRPRWLWRFVRRFRPQPHVWKETKRETLGSYIDYGSCPQEITTIYRIGIHETCLLTGENRIRQIGSLHPQDSSPNDQAVSVESTALFAVRVLTHQGHNDTAEADLIPHLREISARYSELKRTHDFMTSARIAKAEWLARFLSANVEVMGGESARERKE